MIHIGLRGPVAYALAVATPDDDGTLSANIILTTTIIIVAFTTLMLGGLAYPFLRWIKPPIMRSTSQTKTDTYDISNHWFNRLDRRFLRPFFGPKTRRNVNKPLSSVDDIELEDQNSNNNHSDDLQDPKLQLMSNDNGNNKKGAFDMEYVNTNTNEEDAEKEEMEKENRVNSSSKKKKKKRKSSEDDVHLKIGDNASTDTPTTGNNNNKDNNKSSSGLIDYSMPRTQPPSFIDNPREQSEQSNTQTWSDINSLNQSAQNLGQSNNNLEAPIQENKSVTPPPQNVDNSFNIGD